MKYNILVMNYDVATHIIDNTLHVSIFNIVQFLDYFAIRMNDGTYDIIKNRLTAERGIVSEEYHLSILNKYI